jgi:hypothetical protein
MLSGMHPLSGFRVLACAVFLCILQAKMVAGTCRLHVPVYDARGFPLPFRVSEVGLDVDGKVVSLHGRRIDGILTTIAENRVLFSSERIVGRRGIRVVLEGPKGARITSQVVVMSCEQRHSLVYGQEDSGLDVAGGVISGRLSGCAFSGDWWLRSIGLFGGHEGMVADDGAVQADGSFRIPIAATGVRRIVVIGKGRMPVKSVAVDVISGRPVEMGVVDLSGVCPQ